MRSWPDSRWTALVKQWPPGQSALYTCKGRNWKRSDTAEADSVRVVRRALLFDLDDTLMVEESAAAAAFEATAGLASERCNIDPGALASGARSRARELWYAAPAHGYCMRVGISSWEGLWCRFEGEGSDVRALRERSPTYRREAWRLALADQGVDDAGLAEELAERFPTERRARHEVSSPPGSARCGSIAMESPPGRLVMILWRFQR